MNSWEKGIYHENYPHMKCLANIFTKFYTSKNIHVYTVSISQSLVSFALITWSQSWKMAHRSAGSLKDLFWPILQLTLAIILAGPKISEGICGFSVILQSKPRKMYKKYPQLNVTWRMVAYMYMYFKKKKKSRHVQGSRGERTLDSLDLCFEFWHKKCLIGTKINSRPVVWGDWLCSQATKSLFLNAV